MGDMVFMVLAMLHMDMVLYIPEFLSDPAPVWTPSPRDSMPPPRDISDTDTITDTMGASVRLMLTLTMDILDTDMVCMVLDTPDTDTMESTPLMFHSDPAPVLTPSPRVLMPPPRDTLDTTDTIPGARSKLWQEVTYFVIVLNFSDSV